jgi:hypothetical protein
MAVAQQQVFQAGLGTRRLGKQLRDSEEDNGCNPKNRSAQGFPPVARVLHFNSRGCKLQEDRAGFLDRLALQVCLAKSRESSFPSKYSRPAVAKREHTNV